MKKDIYAFFLDIDGTLYDGKTVTEEDRAAMSKVIEEGHKIFINTGRAAGFIPKPVRELPLSGIIASLGTYISYDGRVLRSSILEPDVLQKLVTYSLSNNLAALFEGELDVYTTVDIPWAKKIAEPEDFTAYHPQERIYKFDYIGDASEKDRTFLAQWFDMILQEGYTETVKKGYSKSRGIKIVENYLGIRHDHTVAIGDSPNDEDMIRYAGIGVAMGNACPEIKRAAAFETAKIGQSGVAEAMKKILEGTHG